MQLYFTTLFFVVPTCLYNICCFLLYSILFCSVLLSYTLGYILFCMLLPSFALICAHLLFYFLLYSVQFFSIYFALLNLLFLFYSVLFNSTILHCYIVHCYLLAHFMLSYCCTPFPFYHVSTTQNSFPFYCTLHFSMILLFSTFPFLLYIFLLFYSNSLYLMLYTFVPF